jgi:hypothetical protein
MIIEARKSEKLTQKEYTVKLLSVKIIAITASDASFYLT